MFIQLTFVEDDKEFTISSDSISLFFQHGNSSETTVVAKTETQYTVKESYQEVKKRLGMAISPRAETIMNV